MWDLYIGAPHVFRNSHVQCCSDVSERSLGLNREIVNTAVFTRDVAGSDFAHGGMADQIACSSS